MSVPHFLHTSAVVISEQVRRRSLSRKAAPCDNNPSRSISLQGKRGGERGNQGEREEKGQREEVREEIEGRVGSADGAGEEGTHPNRTPPPAFLPLTGCRVYLLTGPVERTWYLSDTMWRRR